jgi:hypothetical protein
MKIIKLMLLLGALAMPAKAQTFAFKESATATVPATASNVYVIPATRARDISLYVQWNLTGAGTAINRGVLDTSNDGASWKLAVSQWDMTANGATPVFWHTNIVANGIPFWRFTLHNSNSVVATNLVISAVTKPDL